MTLDHQVIAAAAVLVGAVFVAYKLISKQMESVADRKLDKEVFSEWRELSDMADRNLASRLDNKRRMIADVQTDVKSLDRKVSGVVRSVDVLGMKIDFLLSRNGFNVEKKTHHRAGDESDGDG